MIIAWVGKFDLTGPNALLTLLDLSSFSLLEHKLRVCVCDPCLSANYIYL
jgi:hypothetical protein